MLHFMITLLLIFGSTVDPNISEQEAAHILETEYDIVLTDKDHDDWGF